MRRLLLWAAGMALTVAPVTRSHAASPGGAVLFQNHCAVCHGSDGRGKGPDAPLFDPPPRNLRSGFLRRQRVTDVVNRVRHGSTMNLALDPQRLRERATDVEAVLAHLRRLPKINWSRVERGEEMWVDRCELCHGLTGKPGRTGLAGGHRPADISDGRLLKSTDNAELLKLVRHGRRGMPALVPRVSPDDVGALAEYVGLFSPGLTLYNRYCASCHGEDGRPDDDIVEGMRRPGVVFNDAYFATHDDDHLRISIWHMIGEQKPAMPHFDRLLRDTQVRSIIEYLRALR